MTESKTTTPNYDQKSYLQANLMQTRFFILLKQDETWFWNHITHTILTIFFFSADWNSLFRKVRWSDIMNLKIGRAAQCVLLCFARFCKFCTATRSKAQLSCAWVKCGAESTMEKKCSYPTDAIPSFSILKSTMKCLMNEKVGFNKWIEWKVQASR